MKKLATIASMPVVAAIMLLQGIDLPPEAPLEEAVEIIQILQEPTAVDSLADGEQS